MSTPMESGPSKPEVKETPRLISGVYKHYRGGYYQVLGVGELDTGGKYVIYVMLTGGYSRGPRLRIRSVESWHAKAEVGNGSFIERYVYIGEEMTG